MYVLVKLEPRAETVDALLYYVSTSRCVLQEVVLSLYNELIDKGMKEKKVKEYLKQYYIIYVPFLED